MTVASKVTFRSSRWTLPLGDLSLLRRTGVRIALRAISNRTTSDRTCNFFLGSRSPTRIPRNVPRKTKGRPRAPIEIPSTAFSPNSRISWIDNGKHTVDFVHVDNLAEAAHLAWQTAEELLVATGDSATQGYQHGEERAALIAEAVYEAIRKRGINYSNPSGSFERESQKVRSPQAIFEDKCSSCHTGDKYTDGQTWDVGTANEAELITRQELIAMGNDELPPPGQFNTPSLRDLWYTGPYLHSGNAATLMDVLDQTAFKKMQLMGKAWDLDATQKQALVSYLLTL